MGVEDDGMDRPRRCDLPVDDGGRAGERQQLRRHAALPKLLDQKGGIPLQTLGVGGDVRNGKKLRELPDEFGLMLRGPRTGCFRRCGRLRHPGQRQHEQRLATTVVIRCMEVTIPALLRFSDTLGLKPGEWLAWDRGLKAVVL